MQLHVYCTHLPTQEFFPGAIAHVEVLGQQPAGRLPHGVDIDGRRAVVRSKVQEGEMIVDDLRCLLACL